MGQYDIIIDNDKSLGAKKTINYIVVNGVIRGIARVEESDMQGQDIKYIQVNIVTSN